MFINPTTKIRHIRIIDCVCILSLVFLFLLIIWNLHVLIAGCWKFTFFNVPPCLDYCMCKTLFLQNSDYKVTEFSRRCSKNSNCDIATAWHNFRTKKSFEFATLIFWLDGNYNRCQSIKVKVYCLESSPYNVMGYGQ